MAMMSRLMVVYLLFLIVIPILIGGFVYRDAKKRRMNAFLWALAAALIPAFVGLILYLFARGSSVEWMCPACGNAVEESFAVCPHCGTRLRSSCANCGYPLETGWKVCPRCAAPVAEDKGTFTPPVMKREKPLWRLLFLIVAVPAVLLVLVFIFNVSGKNSGAASKGQLTVYDEEMAARYEEELPQVWVWAQNCKRQNPDGIYALHYQFQTGEYGDSNIYLIYRPSAKYVRETSTKGEGKDGLFGQWLAVRFEDTEDPAYDFLHREFYCVKAYGTKYRGLKVYVNGAKQPCEITEVDYDPSLPEDAVYPQDA